MGHHVDDRAWPLLRLTVTGACRPDDVRALTEALSAAAHRAAADTRPFVVVLDYRRRQPAPAADVGTAGEDSTGGGTAGEDSAGGDGFWRARGEEVTRWCAAAIRLDPDDTVTVVHQRVVAGPAVEMTA